MSLNRHLLSVHAFRSPVAALLPLYCRFTASLLSLYCLFTAALLPLYCRFTASLLPLYCLSTASLGAGVSLAFIKF
jgi:hypothetical protein